VSALCAAPGCDRPVRRGGRGRPAIYCSPGCRPSAVKTTRILIEVDTPGVDPNDRPLGHVWQVRIRRGSRAVVVADGVGRLAAATFARQIEAVLTPDSRRGGAIE